MAELTKKNAEQEKQILQQNETISKLQAAALESNISTAEKELPKTPAEPVSVNGKKYKWLVPQFRMPGSDDVLTAEEASTDEKLLKAIVKIEGQGLLQELV